MATIPRPSHTPSEYVDYMYQRGDISQEQRLATIYYRILHGQVHAPLGSPLLTRATMISLSTRFKLYRAHFTPEEREDWYCERTKLWKQLRSSLMDECAANLELIDDMLIYRSTDESYFNTGLSSDQRTMLERAFLHMANFFGLS